MFVRDESCCYLCVPLTEGTGSSVPTAPFLGSSLYMYTVCSEVVCHPAVRKAPANRGCISKEGWTELEA